jgi:hypothetical protein
MVATVLIIWSLTEKIAFSRLVGMQIFPLSMEGGEAMQVTKYKYRQAT